MLIMILCLNFVMISFLLITNVMFCWRRCNSLAVLDYLVYWPRDISKDTVIFKVITRRAQEHPLALVCYLSGYCMCSYALLWVRATSTNSGFCDAANNFSSASGHYLLIRCSQQFSPFNSVLFHFEQKDPLLLYRSDLGLDSMRSTVADTHIVVVLAVSQVKLC